MKYVVLAGSAEKLTIFLSLKASSYAYERMVNPRPRSSIPYFNHDNDNVQVHGYGYGNGNGCSNSSSLRGWGGGVDVNVTNAQANVGGSVSVSDDRRITHHVHFDFSSQLNPESIQDMAANEIDFELGWVPVSVSSSISLNSISIRRNIVRGNDQRMYLSFGLEQGEGDGGGCGYDADKGVLKVNMRLLQMEEEELRENGGCFPLLLESEDEPLTQHNHMNDEVLGRAVVVHLHYNKESKEDPKVQTFLIDLHESSLLRHGPGKFSINERQLLLNAVNVYTKNRGSTNDVAKYSKLSKYYFLNECTGAEIEIRSPSMPILQRTKKGDLTFCQPPTPALTSTKRRSFEYLNDRTSIFLCSTTANSDSVSSSKFHIGGSSSSSSSSGGNDRDSAKLKAKSYKKASFALDSDTSDDDGMQDEYEDDGFIVFGDVDSSEDESESRRPDSEERGDSVDNVYANYNHEDKDFCKVCHYDGNLLVCDGGPHMGGCGSAFHINCIGKNEIPEGKMPFSPLCFGKWCHCLFHHCTVYCIHSIHTYIHHNF